jgi:hypothetical protein
VVLLKTPYAKLRHIEAGVNHSFDSSASELSTSVRGVFNQHFLEAGISGSNKGNLIVRQLEVCLASTRQLHFQHCFHYKHKCISIRFWH